MVLPVRVSAGEFGTNVAGVWFSAHETKSGVSPSFERGDRYNPMVEFWSWSTGGVSRAGPLWRNLLRRQAFFEMRAVHERMLTNGRKPWHHECGLETR
jgi:hypothetical protein